MERITVRDGKELRVIRFEILLSVEVNDYLCKLYVKNEHPFSCVESLQKIQSRLPEYFIRISRNCIINTLHVKSICFKKRNVELTGNKILSFSARNAKVLKRIFSQ